MNDVQSHNDDLFEVDPALPETGRTSTREHPLHSWDGDPEDLVPYTLDLAGDADLCERVFIDTNEAFNAGRFLEARQVAQDD